jgi:peptidoglycan/LPS O-acetylase OafA/YrhL
VTAERTEGKLSLPCLRRIELVDRTIMKLIWFLGTGCLVLGVHIARDTGNGWFIAVGILTFALAVLASWPIDAGEWPWWLDWLNRLRVR